MKYLILLICIFLYIKANDIEKNLSREVLFKNIKNNKIKIIPSWKYRYIKNKFIQKK